MKKNHTKEREAREEKQDKSRRAKLTQVDEALDESFPASDPPSWMPLAHTRMEDKKVTEKNR